MVSVVSIGNGELAQERSQMIRAREGLGYRMAGSMIAEGVDLHEAFAQKSEVKDLHPSSRSPWCQASRSMPIDAAADGPKLATNHDGRATRLALSFERRDSMSCRSSSTSSWAT